MIENSWIETLLQKSEETTQKEQKAHQNPFEQQLIAELIRACYGLHAKKRSIRLGRLLASAFDLLVTADYYAGIGHKGWFYCPSPTPRLYYHFTNCCPRHALENIFYFHASSKPESGSIGRATSRLLRNFLNELLKHNGRQEVILKGAEPIDIVIVNQAKHHIFFGEIKASPLLTLPLAMDSEALTDAQNNKISEHDGNLTINSIYQKSFNVFVPTFRRKQWQENSFYLGSKHDADDKNWSYRTMLELLDRTPDFLRKYYEFWDAALSKYHPKATESVYWLTNGCGAPTPRRSGGRNRKAAMVKGLRAYQTAKQVSGWIARTTLKKGSIKFSNSAQKASLLKVAGSSKLESFQAFILYGALKKTLSY